MVVGFVKTIVHPGAPLLHTGGGAAFAESSLKRAGGGGGQQPTP